MPETYVVTKVHYAGEKPNPHGGVLHKFRVALKDGSEVTDHDVYWQRKSDQLEVGTEVYGHIEQGEYGPRFKTDQRPDGSGNQGSSGGTFSASRYQKEGMTKDEFWEAKNERDVESQARMGRAHAQEMAIRAFAAFVHREDTIWDVGQLRDHLERWTNHFHDDVQRFPIDADVGGGFANESRTTRGLGTNLQPAADVSAEGRTLTGEPVREAEPWQRASPEASPAQKGKLTNLFGKAGLSRDAMKAVVLFRCRSEKATMDGASKLIQDLMDGATHDTLIAEISDAHRSGNDPVATRALKLIPSEVPLAEDPNVKAKDYEDESGVPF